MVKASRMGFYRRRSIRIGALRFKLSNAQIRVSASISALGLNHAVRANYIHIGRERLSYRATLVPSSRRGPSTAESKMIDSSPHELLDELNQKSKKRALCPAIAAGSVAVVLLAAAMGASFPMLLCLMLGGALLSCIARTHDIESKAVALFYDFEPRMEAAFAQLDFAGGQLDDCTASWHIETGRNAPARKDVVRTNNLVRTRARVHINGDAPYVRSNILVHAIRSGRKSLYFFPDRILVFDANGVSAIDYRNIRIETKPTRFIDNDAVPGGSDVVTRTLRYLDLANEQDRQGKFDQELIICRYEEQPQSSNRIIAHQAILLGPIGVGGGLADAITELAGKLPIDPTASGETPAASSGDSATERNRELPDNRSGGSAFSRIDDSDIRDPASSPRGPTLRSSSYRR
jgi:hypothetical protein